MLLLHSESTYISFQKVKAPQTQIASLFYLKSRLLRVWNGIPFSCFVLSLYLSVCFLFWVWPPSDEDQTVDDDHYYQAYQNRDSADDKCLVCSVMVLSTVYLGLILFWGGKSTYFQWLHFDYYLCSNMHANLSRFCWCVGLILNLCWMWIPFVWLFTARRVFSNPQISCQVYLDDNTTKPQSEAHQHASPAGRTDGREFVSNRLNSYLFHMIAKGGKKT